jgi:hypothetical protein
MVGASVDYLCSAVNTGSFSVFHLKFPFILFIVILPIKTLSDQASLPAVLAEPLLVVLPQLRGGEGQMDG